MLTQKEIDDLPLGFHSNTKLATISSSHNSGRGSRRRQSTQSRNFRVQSIKIGNLTKFVKHEKDDRRLASFKGCKWRTKEQIKTDVENNG